MNDVAIDVVYDVGLILVTFKYLPTFIRTFEYGLDG